MNTHVFIYIYVYIYIYIYVYIYIYGYVSVDFCVLWVVSGIIISIFEGATKCLEDLPLSILARTPHKEMCPRESARPEKRTIHVGQLEMRLRSRESDIQTQDAELVSRL